MEKLIKSTITFNGKNYPAWEILINDTNYIISCEELNDAMFQNDVFISEEAEKIDCTILGYISPEHTNSYEDICKELYDAGIINKEMYMSTFPRITINIQKACYELYKIDWTARFLAQNKFPDEKQYYIEYLEFCDEENIKPELYSYKEYIAEYGYNGNLYANYNEFLMTEYQDKEYMENLLQEKDLIMLYRIDRDKN